MFDCSNKPLLEFDQLKIRTSKVWPKKFGSIVQLRFSIRKIFLQVLPQDPRTTFLATFRPHLHFIDTSVRISISILWWKKPGGGGLQKVEILGTAMLEKSSNERSVIQNILGLIAKD